MSWGMPCATCWTRASGRAEPGAAAQGFGVPRPVSLSAIGFMGPRGIFPGRVLGSRLTMPEVLKAATGPMVWRTLFTSSRAMSEAA